MKNNRLTNSEVIELEGVADRLIELSSMENASFGFGDKERDKFIKDNVRAYMMWFRCEAYKIEQILKSNK